MKKKKGEYVFYYLDYGFSCFSNICINNTESGTLFFYHTEQKKYKHKRLSRKFMFKILYSTPSEVHSSAKCYDKDQALTYIAHGYKDCRLYLLGKLELK